MRNFLSSVAGMFLLGAASLAPAADPNMMHCFAFTVIDKATQPEWDAFVKASNEMPKKMKGVVNKVWVGKLAATLAQYAVPADARKKLQGGEKEVDARIGYRPRQWGMCIELKGQNSLKAYADHPYHKEWSAAYEKVRVAGTTTFDILSQ